jgi:hypothetical protein
VPKKSPRPKHVPVPVVVAIVARDEGNVIKLEGSPRARFTVDGKRPLVRGAGLHKIVVLDEGLVSLSYLLGRGVDPLDADDLGPHERARLVEALGYTLEALRK